METMGRKKRPRRSFTRAFKAEVVELVRQPGNTAASVARDLDLTETAVREWVKQADVDAGNGEGGLDHGGAGRAGPAAPGESGVARGARHPQAGDGFLREGDPVNVFPFIEAEKVEQRNVAKACELLEVSRSAFYEWSKHLPSARELADDELGERIEQIHDWVSGHLRVAAGASPSCAATGCTWPASGWRGSCANAVWSAAAGAGGRRPRSPILTTDAAVDLLKRAFGPGTVELDRVYVGDITYIWTWEGWAYLATVIDLASRRVVGWAMADHMRAELVCDALTMAIGARRPAAGAIFHSDRGTQYTSSEFTDAARRPRDDPVAVAGPANAGTTRWPKASSPR